MQTEESAGQSKQHADLYLMLSRSASADIRDYFVDRWEIDKKTWVYNFIFTSGVDSKISVPWRRSLSVFSDIHEESQSGIGGVLLRSCLKQPLNHRLNHNSTEKNNNDMMDGVSTRTKSAETNAAALKI